MFANIKNRLVSVIAPDIPALPSTSDHHFHRGGSGSSTYHQRMAQHQLQDKFVYARPPFLQLLTQDELRASADHNVRPIIVPRDISLLPWGTGYAECVNSGKSEWNEDQGAFCRQVLSDPSNRHPDLPYTYFGIFDGHAGYGAALAASNQFHHILHEKLVDCIELLLPRDGLEEYTQSASKPGSVNSFLHPSQFHRAITKDELIVGALESAFFHMDSLIAQDRDRYRDAGGCTACVALFINGKMYVANAGDSRAVLCQRRSRSRNEPNSDEIVEDSVDAADSFSVPLSFDHTPETERQRLLGVAQYKPHLLGKYYAAMEYARRPHERDLGQRILCRQGTMKGWTYKTLTHEDLRMPVVTGEGKRSRLLGTLGVTRGFGDHDLPAIATGALIKPFLTPQPDVKYRDLTKIVSIPDEHNEDGDYGILVMATDGLWDVTENETVARTVFHTLHKYPTEKHRYTMVAQELVARARGKINDYGHWRLADSKAAATVDDISVMVIPVYQYYREHIEWEQRCVRECRERMEREKAHQGTEAKEEEEEGSTKTDSFLMNGSREMAQVEEEHENEGEGSEESRSTSTLDKENAKPILDKLEIIDETKKTAIEEEKQTADNALIDEEMSAVIRDLEEASISATGEHKDLSSHRTPEGEVSKPKEHRKGSRKDRR